MRHKIYGNKLGRDKDERDRLFKGLISQLIIHGTIQTSESKAKAIKGLVDKVINLAKKRAHEHLQSFLTDKNLRERLLKEIIPKLGDRTSGYTKLLRMGKRLGDQAMMVKMSLIGAEELKPLEKATSDKVQVTRKTEQKKVKKPVIKKATPTKKPIKKKTVRRAK